MKTKPQAVAIVDIQRDMQLQPRATLHQEWIEDYAYDMMNGVVMPPVVVFQDGETFWLTDGFHRTYAAEVVGATTILAFVRQGTRRDALLYSLAANADHGHRRTNDDKRRAIDIMLRDPEWVGWSDSEIARRCGVHQTTVLRRREETLSYAKHRIDTRTVTRGGTTYEMTMPQGAQAGLTPDPDCTSNTPLDDPPQTTPPDFVFDRDAATLREIAMTAIRGLATLPDPEVVIEAWLKTFGYGVPVETVEAASVWLVAFASRYRVVEPGRWAAVQASIMEMKRAAE